MNVNKQTAGMSGKSIIADILGHEDTVMTINGTEFKYRSLTYKEYLHGLNIFIGNSNIKPDSEPEEIISGTDGIMNSYKHRFYVLGLMLEYNGYNKKDLEKDVRLLDRLNPLYMKVVEISQPDEELVKKKDLAT